MAWLSLCWLLAALCSCCEPVFASAAKVSPAGTGVSRTSAGYCWDSPTGGSCEVPGDVLLQSAAVSLAARHVSESAEPKPQAAGDRGQTASVVGPASPDTAPLSRLNGSFVADVRHAPALGGADGGIADGGQAGINASHGHNGLPDAPSAAVVREDRAVLGAKEPNTRSVGAGAGSAAAAAADAVATEASVDAQIAMKAAVAAKAAAKVAVDALQETLQREGLRQHVLAPLVAFDQGQQGRGYDGAGQPALWTVVATLLAVLVLCGSMVAIYLTQTRCRRSPADAPFLPAGAGLKPAGFASMCKLLPKSGAGKAAWGIRPPPSLFGGGQDCGPTVDYAPQPPPVLCADLIVPHDAECCLIVPPLFDSMGAAGSHSSSSSSSSSGDAPGAFMGPLASAMLSAKDRQICIVSLTGTQVFNATYVSKSLSLLNACGGQLYVSARLKSQRSLTFFDGRLGEPFGELELLKTWVDGCTYRFETPHGERLTIRGGGLVNFNCLADDGRLLAAVEPYASPEDPRRSVIVGPGADAGLIVMCFLGIAWLQDQQVAAS
eukprot:TRINITY_DN10643_c0_g1_i3.p1 TRINITY_DN10643_c0_g1~~TRINITY_DN10643_c0_g1_i3.p1  ORF type:complete len:549 (+),score=118.90 TRINITY_DN10643_c0_g1_i3:254-1900(+)